MTDAPKRLWVGPRHKPIGWHLPLATPYPEDADYEVEYVRADIHEAAIAAEREACAKVAEAWVARAMHLSPHGYELERTHGRMVEIAGDEIRARKDTE